MDLPEIIEQAELALQDPDWSGLSSLVEEVERHNFSLIASQSELAAKMHQEGSEFSESLRSLAHNVLDIYEDQQDLAMDFKEAVQERDAEEIEEILDELRKCYDDLQEQKPELERGFETEEARRLKFDDEFYLE